jgi:hypothetical protein
MGKEFQPDMASPQPAKKRITEEEAAERLVDAFEKHLARLKPDERRRKLGKFLKGPKGGTRAK